MNRKELLWISVSIFLTVIAWMILEIYKISYTSNFKQDGDFVIGDTKLSTQVIKILKTKKP